jgi:hypothetical protein
MNPSYIGNTCSPCTSLGPKKVGHWRKIILADKEYNDYKREEDHVIP